MITRFGSLYAGHVDLENEGLDGTPVNDRWLPDEQLLTAFDKATEIAQLILHGLLNLSGYDHETDNGEMNRLERRLRRKLDID